MLLLLRLRFLLRSVPPQAGLRSVPPQAGLRVAAGQPDAAGQRLAEEVLACACRGAPGAGLEWLADEQALQLLAEAHADAPISSDERRELVAHALGLWTGLQPDVQQRVAERAQRLAKAHQRVRASAGLRGKVEVQPQWPPDLLGTLVLLPVPPGVGSPQGGQP